MEFNQAVMKNFSLKDLKQLKEGQILLLLQNNSPKKVLEINEMISNLDIIIDRKEEEINLKDDTK